MSTSGKKKILIGKAGLNGHDRGVRTVAKALEEAGLDVIYTGLHQSPEDFVNKALGERVDAIGVSILTGGHNVIFPRIIELLNEKGGGHIPLFGGGIIPEEDIRRLKEMGVKELFLPGTKLEEIVVFVKGLVKDNKAGL